MTIETTETIDSVSESTVEHIGVRLAKLRENRSLPPDLPIKIGRFVVLDVLGQGGMGTVYSAYDPDLNRRVAIKLVSNPGPDGASEQTRRLLREAQALAHLSHPNVVPVYDVGIIDGLVFIVMELVKGRTLSEWIKSEAPSWEEVMAVYRQAGRALEAAHALGLTHRDFKPSNAIFGADGIVRVLDFGLARRASIVDIDNQATMKSTQSEIDPTDLALTSTGEILGTPAYMPLEQFSNSRVGPLSDQFSFCASLYEALYGQRPFDGASLIILISTLSADRIRQPPANSGVPAWVFQVLARGLSSAPARRYPSMTALMADLENSTEHSHRLSGRLIMFVLLALVILSRLVGELTFLADRAALHTMPVSVGALVAPVVMAITVGGVIWWFRKSLWFNAASRAYSTFTVFLLVTLGLFRLLAFAHGTPLAESIEAELLGTGAVLVGAGLIAVKWVILPGLLLIGSAWLVHVFPQHGAAIFLISACVGAGLCLRGATRKVDR